ncbi:hypothetical protein CK203_006169 [Vitis vinifera]|uniref:Transmembrane and coiled-coil domain-containing protein 4 n=1 Tax=Vitis vinifera TaxID=29760 RepID=A0A438K608_VITVI|nr:hypothetical protein CK203_006169 [Vitis vinifera]
MDQAIHENDLWMLAGYSLGARVIFKCLQYLAKTEQNAKLVERVVLLGAPTIFYVALLPPAILQMVVGGFVNAFSTNDWTLGVVFRANHEIDKVTTVVRAELANHNVETITHTSTLDRVLRAELVNQNAETITTTNKLDRDIHAVRAQLEAAKYDVIKYCMGTIVSILALSFAAIRMLM